MDTMRTATLAYNPNAGRFPSRLLAERAAALLHQEGWQMDLQQSQDGAHLTELARQAADNQRDAFFVVGGDGSINLAVQGLLGSNTALGVLPAGTANVWSQELGLPGLTWTRWMALEESARHLSRGVVRRVDVGLCNGLPFLLWAGVGLDAFIVHHLEPRSRWEKYLAVPQYATSALWNAGFWHGMELKVEADGLLVSGHFLLGVVSNIHLYAGGYAELSPAARLDDQQMELWLFKGESLGDIVLLAWQLLSGQHLNSDQAIHMPVRSLRMESGSPMYVQVDGEPAEVQGPIDIQILPRALTVLAPRTTPHPLFVHSDPHTEDAETT